MRTRSRIALLAACATLMAAALPAAAHASFGVAASASSAENADGTLDFQAGSHPYGYTASFEMNQDAEHNPEGSLHTIAYDLPPGLFGSPLAAPRCPKSAFDVGNNGSCPTNTQVGVATVTLAGGLPPVNVPVYNLVPPYGVAASFGFTLQGYNTIEHATVREGDYGVRILDNTIPPLQIRSFSQTIWSIPSDPGHDALRSCRTEAGLVQVGCPSGTEDTEPFLSLPTSCQAPPESSVRAGSTESPDVLTAPVSSFLLDESGSPRALAGCEAVPFSPTISTALTSRLASAPSGLDFELDRPNAGLESPNGILESAPEKAEVTLPEGVTVNPSAAEGIAVCTEAQLERESAFSAPGEGCPQASKLGSLSATTPVLEEPIEGALYLAKPYENPAHSLIALYMVGRLPDRGIIVKQVGKVEPDPKTGQLVSTFEDLPPFPYTNFKLHFREGARAPLVTPPSCGTDVTVARFTPYSDPAHPYTVTSSFATDRGVDGGACPSGSLPFNPSFEAGTLNNAAAAHSPLVMRLTRKDGDQDLTKISTTLPPGLLASLVGVSKCTDAQIAAARARTGPNGGHEELASPSCPATSQIGTTMTGAGVGGVLTYVPGNLYLAGPYNGAPLSVVAIVPGVAGPFDVGTIVVRLALRFNPVTAQAEADGASSDPIPHILRGIPLKVRDIRVYVNRPNWIFNPTSCEPEATVGTLWGGGQNVFSTADDSPFALAARFQAADCANLAFKPALHLKLKGGTKRGKFPALRGEYKPRPGDANLNGLVLRLPTSEFIEQGHFQTICTRVQYAAGAGFGSQCPAGSVYGWATAYTPLLEEPLEGPVRLRSSNHNLPDLVASLHGIADIEAVARIDSKEGGLRATFSDLPDAPITKVVVSMQGGKKGLIVNSTDICVGTHRTDAAYTAQSGKRAEGNPALQAQCKGKGKRKRGGR